MTSNVVVLLRSAPALALCAALSSAQSRQYQPSPSRLVLDEATRIADPKLAGGDARFGFHLIPAGIKVPVQVEVLSAGVLVRKLWNGSLVGSAHPTRLQWNGRDDDGERVPTGTYLVRVSGPGLAPLELPLDVVRLGVTEIEAQDSASGADDEFQMVYFRKGSEYLYYATPAIHEYVNAARAGEVSDLDLDDGSARPVVAVHTDTATPVLDGAEYDTQTYNYPLAYVKGASPRLELTFGASATSAQGLSMGAGYPVAGWEIRVACDAGVSVPGAELATPGGTALVDLAALPAEVGRAERALTLHWEARRAGTNVWSPIAGQQLIPLRFYMLLGPPIFKSGATGGQYAGPWVEVAEYFASWKQTLGLPATDQQEMTQVFVKGFFGQNGGLTEAIEGVVYDAYPLGGDGGATHYFSFPAWRANLSRLLNHHAAGRYINCTDNMGATTTMMSMLGAVNMRPVRLGTMNLRALWGIGAPGYTLDLWGFGSHGFSYHHIVTDDGAVTVSDTCMQLDEDGNSLALPGTPGWNVRRPWNGTNGYEDLAATNNVTKNVETLPGLQ